MRYGRGVIAERCVQHSGHAENYLIVKGACGDLDSDGKAAE